MDSVTTDDDSVQMFFDSISVITRIAEETHNYEIAKRKKRAKVDVEEKEERIAKTKRNE